VKPPRAAVKAATKRRKHAACSEVPDSGARPKIPRQGRVSQRRRHDCESARYSGCAFRLVSQKIAALKKWASKSPLGHSATCRTVRAMAAFAPTADIGCAGFMSTRPNKTNGAWSAFRLGLNCCYRNFPDLPAGPRRIHGRRGNESPRAPQRTRPRHAPEMALTVKKSC
jgi:hypothetical protein